MLDEEDNQDVSDREPPGRREEPSLFLYGFPVYDGTDQPESPLNPGQCPTCGTLNDLFDSYCWSVLPGFNERS